MPFCFIKGAEEKLDKRGELSSKQGMQGKIYFKRGFYQKKIDQFLKGASSQLKITFFTAEFAPTGQYPATLTSYKVNTLSQ